MAFDRGVRAKTVTLDGDSFEPQGTLTGGSKSTLGVILGRLAELQGASRELGVHEERLRGVEDKIKRLSAASKKVCCVCRTRRCFLDTGATCATFVVRRWATQLLKRIG